MTDTKFTDGPWVVTDECNDKKYSVVRRSSPSSVMRDIQCDNVDDANLIASAPDMYKILDEVPKMLSHAYSTAINDVKKLARVMTWQPK